MTTLPRILTVSAFALTLAVSMSSPVRGEKPTPVTVTNTTAAPVPVTVQGSAAISGNVQVTNSPTVNVGNMPNVRIINSSALPVLTRDIDTSGSQPSILSCSELASDNLACSTTTVPSGKRMVVQMISANLAGDNLNGSVTPVLYAVRLQQSNGSGTEGVFDYFLPLTAVGIYNRYYPFWVGAQSVSLFLDEGKGLYGATEITTTGVSRGHIEIQAFGYLISK